MPEYEFRPYRPGDEHGILATFNVVFAEGNPDFVPRTMADWQWTYAQNPGGIRVWVATFGDLIAAHYASQPNRVLVEGDERVFAQIIDSMVHPEHRRGLKRPGLFVETARRMLAATCGPDKDLVTYGWPIPEAWRMGKTFLQYEMVRRQTTLAREPGPGPSELPAGIALVRRADPSVGRLYARCAEAWGASTIRDARYLDWRLFEGPRHTYQVLAALDGDGAWAGYVVYRRTDWPVPGAGMVLDWLVPDDETETGEALLAAVLARCRAEGVSVLLAMFPEWSPWFLRWQERGFLARASTYLMSGRNNDPRHDMPWLRDHWWYQPLEIDFL